MEKYGMGMGMALLNINRLIRRSFPRSRKAAVAASITSFCTKAVVKPWLMLPPSGSSVYDLYSVADDKVVSLNKGDHPELFKSSSDDYDEELIVGSSHGWIVYYINKYAPEGDSVFLSNPVSHQHIKLPKLPNDPDNPDDPPMVSFANVIISSPRPDEDLNCRAVMKYTSGCLAFCCPACSSNWTPFGNKNGGYCSSVYSARQKLFFCLTEQDQIEAWDLNDLNSPIMISPLSAIRFKESFHRRYPAHFDFMFNRSSPAHFDLYDFESNNHDYVYNSFDRSCFKDLYPSPLDPDKCLYLYNSSDRTWYKDLYPSRLNPSACLAVAEKSDDLYQVRRFTTCVVDINGLPYKTLHFDVYKYDKGLEEWGYMDGGSLDGMAFFVGINHGFALSAADYPHLKPDAIYFTDIQDFPENEEIGGGHDIGIFNYRDRTISPCYYPCDYPSIKQLLPPPFWITLQI